MTKQHDPRFCVTCDRQLPRRAYRTRCASCIKEAHGWHRVINLHHVNSAGRRVRVLSWVWNSEESRHE